MSAIDTQTVEAMLQRGRTRMVQAYVNEGGLIDPQEMHTYWRGFAQCAAALLNGTAQVMASHDQATESERTGQAAFAALPDDLERLTLADMKRHMWSQGIYCAADLVPSGNVDAIEQLQNAVGAAVKQDDKHAIAAVDVQDGGSLHMTPSGVVEFVIVREVPTC
jgi:hypothetical protein